jgi:hypothetical protein
MTEAIAADLESRSRGKAAQSGPQGRPMRPSNGSGYETGAEDIAPTLFVTPYG